MENRVAAAILTKVLYDSNENIRASIQSAPGEHPKAAVGEIFATYQLFLQKSLTPNVLLKR